MKVIQNYIAEKQRFFTDHVFFRRLAETPELEALAPFALDLSFWVMSFQDILRLNETRVSDAALRKIARHHRAEDSGHDRWFISDLALLGLSQPDMRTLFDKEHEATRHASYQLVSEVFQAQNDFARIALLLTLESSGHVFFESTASYFERLGDARDLKYFSRFHLEIEKKHAMFEKQMDDYLGAIALDEETREQCLRLVDRCYDAFNVIFDNVDRRFDARVKMLVATTNRGEEAVN